jgi:hypothetical protein
MILFRMNDYVFAAIIRADENGQMNKIWWWVAIRAQRRIQVLMNSGCFSMTGSSS